MRLLEYESKEILKKHGISVPPAQLISSSGDLHFDAPSVLKVQIPLGGRGKAGDARRVSARVRCGNRVSPHLPGIGISR